MSVSTGITRAMHYLTDRGYEVVRIDLTEPHLEMLKREWPTRPDPAVVTTRFMGVLIETSPFMPGSVVVAKDVLGGEIEEDILP